MFSITLLTDTFWRRPSLDDNNMEIKLLPSSTTVHITEISMGVGHEYIITEATPGACGSGTTSKLSLPEETDATRDMNIYSV
jgi:hypothetical protein